MWRPLACRRLQRRAVCADGLPIASHEPFYPPPPSYPQPPLRSRSHAPVQTLSITPDSRTAGPREVLGALAQLPTAHSPVLEDDAHQSAV